MKYYLISFIYRKNTIYCIWVSDDEDYVITNKDGILFFKTIDAVKCYEQRNNIIIEKNKITQYNLDTMILWCKDEKNVCSCEEILNLWNICFDIANSLKKHFIGDKTIYDNLYEKIFFANNVFDNNLETNTTLSNFTKPEIKKMKKILENGIKIIIDNIENHKN